MRGIEDMQFATEIVRLTSERVKEIHESMGGGIR